MHEDDQLGPMMKCCRHCAGLVCVLLAIAGALHYVRLMTQQRLKPKATWSATARGSTGAGTRAGGDVSCCCRRRRRRRRRSSCYHHYYCMHTQLRSCAIVKDQPRPHLHGDCTYLRLRHRRLTDDDVTARCGPLNAGRACLRLSATS